MKTDTLLIVAAAGAGLYFMSRTLKTTVSNAIPAPRPAGVTSGTFGTSGTASSLNNGGTLPPVYGLPLFGAITPFGMASFGDDPYGLRSMYGLPSRTTTADSNPFNAYINR